MAQAPVPSRTILQYEENWEESLTSLGPGPSHWLFTGGCTVQVVNDNAIDSGLDVYRSKKMSGHSDTSATEPFGQPSPSWTPTDDTAISSGNCAEPGLLRELSRASVSVDSLETCPSLRASPSQLSLASWTSFDILDPDPFHADAEVIIATPTEIEHVSETAFSLELARSQHKSDVTTFKQFSRRHFALHQHPQLASRPFPKPLPLTTTPVQTTRSTSHLPARKSEIRPTVRPRHPLLVASATQPPVASQRCAVGTASSGVSLTAATVQRPHVATQPATLATSPAAWSMRSFLEGVGDAASSAAVRSLRRMIRVDDAQDAPAQQAMPKPVRKSRSALPHDWVMV